MSGDTCVLPNSAEQQMDKTNKLSRDILQKHKNEIFISNISQYLANWYFLYFYYVILVTTYLLWYDNYQEWK